MVKKTLKWHNLICVCDSKIKFHHQMPNTKEHIKILKFGLIWSKIGDLQHIEANLIWDVFGEFLYEGL